MIHQQLQLNGMRRKLCNKLPVINQRLSVVAKVFHPPPPILVLNYFSSRLCRPLLPHTRFRWNIKHFCDIHWHFCDSSCDIYCHFCDSSCDIRQHFCDGSCEILVTKSVCMQLCGGTPPTDRCRSDVCSWGHEDVGPSKLETHNALPHSIHHIHHYGNETTKHSNTCYIIISALIICTDHRISKYSWSRDSKRSEYFWSMMRNSWSTEILNSSSGQYSFLASLGIPVIGNLSLVDLSSSNIPENSNCSERERCNGIEKVTLRTYPDSAPAPTRSSHSPV